MSDPRLLPAGALAWLTAALAVAWHPAVAGGVAAVAAGIALGWRARPALSATATVVAFIAGCCSLQLWLGHDAAAKQWVEAGRTVEVTATVSTDQRLSASGTRWAEIRLWSMSDRRQQRELSGRAIVFLPAGQRPLAAGDRVVMRGTLDQTDSVRHIAVMNVSTWRLLGRPPWWRAANWLRSHVTVAFDDHAKPAAGLVPALVMGDESGLDEITRARFDDSGLTHLLAVSGTNITILVVCIGWSVSYTVGRRWLVPVTLAAIVVFVLMARPEPSVVRAGVMGAVAAGSLGWGAARSARSLSLAVIILLGFDPWLSRQMGFVLSVSATAGIVMAGPLLRDRLERWLPRGAATAIAVPLAAQLACLPALAAISSQISLVAVFANMLAAPFVPIATVAGFGAGLLAIVAEPLGHLAAWPGVLAAGSIVEIARIAAAQPGAVFTWSHGWIAAGCLALAVLAGVATVARYRLLFVLLTVVLAWWIVAPLSTAWPEKRPAIVMCDVGQGAATVILGARAEVVVVDVGEFPQKIDQCLRNLGIERIDVLVLTHNDADHVAGQQGLHTRTVAQVFQGPSGGSQLQAPTRQVSRGETFRLGTIELDVLWPGSDKSLSTNDSSVVLKARVGGLTALLTADLSASAQRRMARTKDLRADVIQVPHHGSADFWPGIYEATGATIALISVGADNRHGHPSQDALDAARDAEVRLWRTDLQGTVAVVDDEGPKVVVR